MRATWCACAWTAALLAALGAARAAPISEVQLAGSASGSWANPSVSPDGKRIAYVSTEAGKSFVVVDGLAGKAYDHVDLGMPLLSPDGRRVAYWAREQGEALVVADGAEGPHFKSASLPGPFLNNLQWSDNGKRLVYRVMQGGGHIIVVTDQIQGKPYDNVSRPQLSADGSVVTYLARSAGTWFAVRNGEEIRQFPGLDDDADFRAAAEFRVSPDGTAWAAVILTPAATSRVVTSWGADWTYDCDNLWQGDWNLTFARGERKESLVAGTSLTLSPDGKSVAFWTGRYNPKKQSSDLSMTVNGKAASPPFRYVFGSRPVFSPDSLRLAYPVSLEPERWSLVVDGKQGPSYDEIGAITFSPDSRHVAYVAIREGSQMVVLDGSEQRAYDNVGSVVFGPDGRELAYVAREGDSWRVVLGKQAGKPYAAILSGPRFVGPQTVVYVAQRDGIWRVQQEAGGGPAPR